MAELSTNVRYIKGIGETRAKALEKLGISSDTFPAPTRIGP